MEVSAPITVAIVEDNRGTREGLVELLGRLEAGAGVRDTNRARLYAAVDECVAAMVDAADRRPRETGEG